jgi:glycosidase
MKKTRVVLILMLTFLAHLFGYAASPKLQHMHPLNWWSGMQNSQLQVLLHGDNIGDCDVTLSHAQNVSLIRVEKVANPNYLFIYLDLRYAKPQTFNFCLTKPGQKKAYLVQPFELKERTGEKIEPFGPQDVLYLLMPDRFINGNAKLDNVPGMVEPKVDLNAKNDMGRHGGDLAGIEKALDYLEELGITAIWPTPVQENDVVCSYHGYSITDYYKIDPRLGTNEDYRKLVEDCHKHGIKMVMDLVFNHCGVNNFLYKDLPAKDWFNFDSTFEPCAHRTASIGDPHASKWDIKHTTDGWFVEQMPDWNQRNPLVKDYLIQSSIWWVEYAKINGIRQDTYPYADREMMRDWNLALEREYPGFVVVGETWINNAPSVAYWQKDSKLSDFNSELRSVMDFTLMNLLNTILDEESNDYDSGLMKLYYYLSGDFIYADSNYLLTFLDNHDTSRFQTNEEQAQNVSRYKQALLLLLTLRGIPQLYYGDEVGMYSHKQMGDGMMRQNLPVEVLEASGRSALQKEYFDFASKLLKWRRNCKALHTGDLTHFALQNGCYAYSRSLNGQRVTVFLNGTDEDKEIDLERYEEILPSHKAKNVLSGEMVTLQERLSLKKRGFLILEF